MYIELHKTCKIQKKTKLVKRKSINREKQVKIIKLVVSSFLLGKNKRKDGMKQMGNKVCGDL